LNGGASLNKVLASNEQGRQHYQNPDLFMLEIANTALNFRHLDRSLNEYLRFLDKNPANLYFISNQCRIIIAEDSSLVSVIGSTRHRATTPC
jgi:hypothetical protein